MNALPKTKTSPLVSSDLSETELVDLARQGDETAIRAIVQRYNRRLFRLARSVVRNDGEAEDIVQAAYVRAFTSMDTFRQEAQFSTWLTRIAMNEALGRLRRRRKTTALEEIDMQAASGGGHVLHFPSSLAGPNPESELSRTQARHLLEMAVDELPDGFRMVFVMRDVEGMSAQEVASQLDIKVETVKTRLHRARKLMRASIERQLEGAFSALFPFDGARCVSMADRVVESLKQKQMR
ncbi:RNA polymerase sigma factor [Rhizobium sp. KVB221]|uniref:RNA polymerase sigma factor n=1 Tax=Rhizobium setariae TaxID=2801340 RepID=A0A937CPQ3_9HYPH|nr:RNA polymerase sigma factor [Rhizobium setariae]MBL0375186.1 RNA polymerase sigma factor [Rhizobium setariae]